jgi:hypothetical protein
MRGSYTLYRAETAGALAQLEAARERMGELEREIEALRAEIARLRLSPPTASGEFPRLNVEIKAG